MTNMLPRRAKRGATFGYTGPDGSQRELVADKNGLVTPETAYDVDVLDGFGLPIARAAATKDQAAEVFENAKAGAADVPRETDTSMPAETGAEG